MLKRIAAVGLFFVIFAVTALAVSAQGTTTYINNAVLPVGQTVTIPPNGRSGSTLRPADKRKKHWQPWMRPRPMDCGLRFIRRMKLPPGSAAMA